MCCSIKYACVDGLIWDFINLQPADGLLLAGLSTLAQGMPLKNNEGYLKTYIKLGPDLENSFKVFDIYKTILYIYTDIQ